MAVELDIVIPVFNEGENIVSTLESLREHVKTRFRVLICYDHDSDNTLTALDNYQGAVSITRIKNQGSGVLSAILTGFSASSAHGVLLFPADDDYNAPRLDAMVEKMRQGCEIVSASRFMPGGCMVDCPLLKSILVRSSAFVLYHLALLPTHDASNGFRLFTQRVLREIPIESRVGFAYSIELLVKAHRLGWKIGESPVAWYERHIGKSRFQVIEWLPQYLKWFFYAFATTYLRLGPLTVHLNRKESY